MKIKAEKINILMAKNIMNPYDLCSKAGFSYQTYRNLLKKSTCKPATVGKIAHALKCDVSDIIDTEND